MVDEVKDIEQEKEETIEAAKEEVIKKLSSNLIQEGKYLLRRLYQPLSLLHGKGMTPMK